MPRYDQRPAVDYSTKVCPLTLFTSEPKLCVTDGCAAWKGGEWSGCQIISSFGAIGYNMNIQAKKASLTIKGMANNRPSYEGGGE
jgi:hypothetical protein